MNKNHFYIHAIFLIVILLIAIPTGLFILMELFGYKEVNQFFKDHGSLIAGILGFSSIFILVANQNSSTKKTVEATIDAIHLESFEIKKRECVKTIIDTMSNIDLISENLNNEIFTQLNKNFRDQSMFRFSNIKHLPSFLEYFWKYFTLIHHMKDQPPITEDGIKEIDNELLLLKKSLLFHLINIPNEFKVSLLTTTIHSDADKKQMINSIKDIEKIFKAIISQNTIWNLTTEYQGNKGYQVNPEYYPKLIEGIQLCPTYLKAMQVIVMNLEISKT